MSNLINEFFDLNKPCPDKIPNCQQLRDEYQKALDEKRASRCSACEELKIKTKYMEIAWNAFINTI